MKTRCQVLKKSTSTATGGPAQTLTQYNRHKASSYQSQKTDLCKIQTVFKLPQPKALLHQVKTQASDQSPIKTNAKQGFQAPKQSTCHNHTSCSPALDRQRTPFIWHKNIWTANPTRGGTTSSQEPYSIESTWSKPSRLSSLSLLRTLSPLTHHSRNQIISVARCITAMRPDNTTSSHEPISIESSATDQSPFKTNICCTKETSKFSNKTYTQHKSSSQAQRTHTISMQSISIGASPRKQKQTGTPHKNIWIKNPMPVSTQATSSQSSFNHVSLPSQCLQTMPVGSSPPHRSLILSSIKISICINGDIHLCDS